MASQDKRKEDNRAASVAGSFADSSAHSSVNRPGNRLVIGFIDLIDAAPLIVALEEGYFAQEGLAVVLDRQLGWGSIRDRLTFGQLDAAHALLGMPLFSQLRRDWFAEPLAALMGLGCGGDAITLSRRLVEEGVKSAEDLSRYIRDNPRRESLVIGHVFSCSVHHYLLREWLSSGGIDPDRDLRLQVFPPNQLVGHMAHGHVDGFCVGEPWNTLAQHNATGQIVAMTTDIVPNHPDKVLAVTRRWMEANEPLLVPLVRALLRACAFCDDPRNHDALAKLLSQPRYLNAPRQTIRHSLGMDIAQANSGEVRSFAPAAMFPSKTHSAWLASQMIRWRHLSPEMDVVSLAQGCCESRAFRTVAKDMGLTCPEDDFPAMALKSNMFDPKESQTRVQKGTDPATNRYLKSTVEETTQGIVR